MKVETITLTDLKEREDQKKISPKREAWLKRKAQLKALRKQLNADFPEIFDYVEPKPLICGIHNELFVRYPQYSRKLIRFFLGVWTQNKSYLQMMLSAANRVNLDNKPVEPISDVHKERAKELLEKTNAKKTSKEGTNVAANTQA